MTFVIPRGMTLVVTVRGPAPAPALGTAPATPGKLAPGVPGVPPGPTGTAVFTPAGFTPGPGAIGVRVTRFVSCAANGEIDGLVRSGVTGGGGNCACATTAPARSNAPMRLFTTVFII